MSPPSTPLRKRSQFSPRSKWCVASNVGALVIAMLFLASAFASAPSTSTPSFLDVLLGTKPVEHVEESGFYNPEHEINGDFRWTNGHAKLVIPLDKKNRPLSMRVELVISRPPPVAGWVQILVNQQEILYQDSITESQWKKTLDLGGIDLGEKLTVEVISDTFVPKGIMDNGKNTDTRSLGVQVRMVKLLTTRASGVLCRAIAPDGKSLVSGDLDGTIKIWDVATTKERASFPGILPGLRTIAVNRDASRFAASTVARQVQIFDEKGQHLTLLGKHEGEITAMTYSPDGKTLAVAGGIRNRMGELKLWDVETGKERVVIEPFNLPLSSVAYSPDGQKVAVAGIDRTAHTVDATTGKVLSTFSHSAPIRQVAFSGDGKLLAAALAKTGEVHVLNVGERKKIAALRGKWESISSLEFAPNARCLRLTFGDGMTTVWNVDVAKSNVQFIATLKNTEGNAGFAMFVRDGETLLTVGNDGKIRLWSISPSRYDIAQATPTPDDAIDCVGLQYKTNARIDYYLPENAELEEGKGKLPKGKHTFGGVLFDVGDGLIQLGGKQFPRLPPKVEGIAVGATAKSLHFLHAACYAAPHDDEMIGKYVVNYEDKSRETIDIVYRQDVRDWYCLANDKDVARGKNVWSGYKGAAARQGRIVCLFLTSWKNPEPAKRIATIDYLSTMKSSSPFCVAISLVRK